MKFLTMTGWNMRSNNRKKNGFSVVELLVAVGIISVLMGVSFVTLFQHQKDTRRVELDAVAREIFVAAQNHLTMAQSQGLLEKIDPSIAGHDAGTADGSEAGVYYYVVTDHGFDQKANDALSLMLPFGSLDDTVRNGSYVIRYQKDAARVLDVFYAIPGTGKYEHTFSGTDAGEYNHLVSNCKPGASGTPTEEAAQAARYTYNYNGADTIIGWYGGNGLSVEVDDTQNAGKGAQLKLIVTGETSGNSRSFTLINGGTDSPNIGGIISSAGAGRKVMIRLDDITQAAFTLDGVGRDSGRFNDIMNPTGTAAADKLIPGENIIISAEVSYPADSGKLGMATSAKKRANSLFASQLGVDTDTNGHLDNFAVTISNLRHFENLGTSVSGFDAKDYNESAKPKLPVEARQTRNFVKTYSWSGFKKKINTSDPGSVVIHYDNTTTDAGKFMPVTPQYVLQYDGVGCTISGITVAGSGASGLFGAVEQSGSAISDLRLLDFDIVSSDGNAGALADTLSDTSIARVIAYNKPAKGATAAELSADMVREAKLEITGHTNVGGLVGSMTGGSADMVVASVFVRSAQTAGGLIGNAANVSVNHSYSGGHTKEKVFTDKVTDPRNLSGAPEADLVGRINVIGADPAADPTAKIGGLIGTASGTTRVDFSYTTCSIRAGADTTGLIGGVSDNSFVADPTHVYAATSGSGTVATTNEAAICYDYQLQQESKGLYYYQTIHQLDTSLSADAIPDYMKIHYGDWTVTSASLEVVNGAMLYAKLHLISDISSIELTVSVGNNDTIAEDTTEHKTKTFTLRTSALNEATNVDTGRDNNVRRVVEKDATMGSVTGYSYYVILDDVTTQNMRFADIFKTEMSDYPNNFHVGANITKVKSTVEDLNAPQIDMSTPITKSNGVLMAPVNVNFADAAFNYNTTTHKASYASGTKMAFNADDNEVGIANFRHFENIDARISQRRVNETAARKLEIAKAVQKNDLWWMGNAENGFVENIKKLNDDMKISNPTDPAKVTIYSGAPEASAAFNNALKSGVSAEDVSANSYQPVNVFLTGKNFTYDGGGKSIYKLKVKGPKIKDEDFGLSYFDTPIKNRGTGNNQWLGSMEIYPANYESTYPYTYFTDAGLFGFVDLKKSAAGVQPEFAVQNLTLVDTDIEDVANAGSVIGRVNQLPVAAVEEAYQGSVKISNVVSKGEVYIFGHEIVKPQNAGGRADRELHARGYAGGLIGLAGEATVTIDHSYVHGRHAFIRTQAVEDDNIPYAKKGSSTYGGSSSGGLIGSLQWCVVDIQNSSATTYVFGENGDVSGGLIGRSYGTGKGSQILHTYVGGHTYGGYYQNGIYRRENTNIVAANVVGYRDAGGFIGYISLTSNKSIRIEDCFSAASVYNTWSSNINNNTRLGGFIGWLNKEGNGEIYLIDNYVIGEVMVDSGFPIDRTGMFIGDASKATLMTCGGNKILTGMNDGRLTRWVGTCNNASCDNSYFDGKSYGGKPIVKECPATDLKTNTIGTDRTDTYDRSGAYPYTMLSGWTEKYHGDWGEVKADTAYDLEWNVTNNDKLSINMQIPFNAVGKGRCWASLRIKGCTSGKSYFVPLLIQAYGDGVSGVNAIRVTVEDPTQVINSYSYPTDVSAWPSKNATIRYTGKDEGKQIHNIQIVLDELDGRNEHFTQRFPNLYPGENIDVYVASGKVDLSRQTKDPVNQGSLAEGAETVTTKCIQATDNTKVIRANSLFANGTGIDGAGSDKNNVAWIKFGRHLQNLEPKISAINNGDNRNGLFFKSAIQKSGREINWGSEYSGQSLYAYNDDKALTTDGLFYGIANNYLFSYKGENDGTTKAKIKNISISQAASDVGIFRQVSEAMEISNLDVEGVSATATGNNYSAGALIGKVGSPARDIEVLIKDVTFRNVPATTESVERSALVISSTQGHAGGVIGSVDDSSTNLKKLTIQNTFVDGTVSITSAKNDKRSGGIVGYIGKSKANADGTPTANLKTLRLGSASTTMNILGTSSVGGVVGSVAQDRKGSITNFM